MKITTAYHPRGLGGAGSWWVFEDYGSQGKFGLSGGFRTEAEANDEAARIRHSIEDTGDLPDDLRNYD